MIVLDTHILLWWLSGTGDLSSRARKAIDKAAAQAPLVLSAISVFEIGTGVRRQRIQLAVPFDHWLADVCKLPELRMMAVTAEVSAIAASYDSSVHGDPADRIILATAQVLGLPLGTSDEKLRASQAVALAW